MARIGRIWGLSGGLTVLCVACASGQGGDGDTELPEFGSSSGTTADSSTSLDPIPATTQDASTGADASGDSSSSGAGTDTGGCEPQTWYPDADDDGHGAAAGSVQDCEQPAGYVPSDDDCDDNDDMRYPGLEEICDGQDNDCDDIFDEYSAMNTSCNGCELTEYDGHSYAACSQVETWANARAACAALFGGDLYKIDDADENDGVNLLLETLDPAGRWWIGLSDIVIEGDFVWIDDTIPAFENWEPMEPNDTEGEDCTELRAGSGFAWNDNNCGGERTFLCEAPAP